MMKDEITPFRIEVPEDVLSDLQQRLEHTRWSYQVVGTNWDAGTDLDYLKELVAYWQGTYDWRKQEAALNRFAHFKTKVDGIGIHFVYERGKGPNPFPIILTHGYPRFVFSIRENNSHAHRSGLLRRTRRRCL
jgi:Epoxide hydrolase N terminus